MPYGVTTMACRHVVEYDCQGQDCPAPSLDGKSRRQQQAICRETESCARSVAHARNLGHLEREEGSLPCEVRSLPCNARMRQSSQAGVRQYIEAASWCTAPKGSGVEQERLAARFGRTMAMATSKVVRSLRGRCALKRPYDIGRQQHPGAAMTIGYLPACTFSESGR